MESIVRRQRLGMGEAMEDNTVHCERHGPARMAFICLHLVHGSGLRVSARNEHQQEEL